MELAGEVVIMSERENEVPVSEDELPEVPGDDEDYNLPFTD